MERFTKGLSLFIGLTVICAWVGGAQAAIINVPGDYATLQAAVTAAIADDVIIIAAGTYSEQLYIDKNLTLTGAGIGQTFLNAPDPIDRTTYSITTWTGVPRTIDAVIGAVGATVHISGLTIDGRDTGPDNYYGIHFQDACSGSVTYCTVDGVTYPTSPGAQRVVSMAFSQSAATGPFTVDVSHNIIPDFQKGGIYVGGPNMVFTVDQNNVTANISPDIAGNGIQLSYGATGSTYKNTVAGVGYTGTDWAGTGILLFESGDVVMDGDIVTGSEKGVNYSNWGWVYNHPVAVNLEFRDLILTGNEWSFGTQLSNVDSDLDLVMTDCTITGSTADAIDIWGTGVDPWGGIYYPGWDNGDLTVTITGLTLDSTGYDGIWTGDLSGNATNTVHAFSVTGSSFTNTVGGAIANTFGATIDAPLNFWGDPSGPTLGLKSAGTRPGALLPSPAGFDLPEKGFTPNVPGTTADKLAETITGPVNVSPWYGEPIGTIPMTYGTSTSINDVIALANNGDTIIVAAGTYGEYLNLTKSLTLLGATPVSTRRWAPTRLRWSGSVGRKLS